MQQRLDLLPLRLRYLNLDHLSSSYPSPCRIRPFAQTYQHLLMSEITPGQPVPTFELPDERGRPWNLLERCADGPVVLVFYRGDW